ncbi:MAG: DUF5615 family PIN-like protein [Candidatus Binatia bacterium]
MTSKPKFVADESCDFAVVRALREAGFSVLAVAESAPQTSDVEVLELASSSDAVLLTEDRDFGRLVFAERRNARGVVLLRFAAKERLEIARRMVELARSTSIDLETAFVTLSQRSARVRSLPRG